MHSCILDVNTQDCSFWEINVSWCGGSTNHAQDMACNRNFYQLILTLVSTSVIKISCNYKHMSDLLDRVYDSLNRTRSDVQNLDTGVGNADL